MKTLRRKARTPHLLTALFGALLLVASLPLSGCVILTETFPGPDDKPDNNAASNNSANNSNNNVNNSVNNSTVNNNPANNNPANNNPANNNPGNNNPVNNNPRTCETGCLELAACVGEGWEALFPGAADPAAACVARCEENASCTPEPPYHTTACLALAACVAPPEALTLCADLDALCGEGSGDAAALLACLLDAPYAQTAATPPLGDTQECYAEALRAAAEDTEEGGDACATFLEARALCEGPSAECVELCGLLEMSCTEERAVYPDAESCYAACALLPLGESDEQGVRCRILAAQRAEAEPELYCDEAVCDE